MNKSQSGSHILIILVVVAVIAIIGALVFVFISRGANFNSATTNQEAESDDKPPVLAKNIGFKFDDYDPVTQSSGDFVFADILALDDPLVGNQLWMDYGAVDPKPGSTMKNPQTVFLLPTGTKVTSMVDGEIVGLQEFSNNDFGIMIAKDKNSKWRYEHEHITKPTVKLGDKVKAGDVIAEVKQHTNTWQYPGYGLFEIGLYRSHPNGVGGSEDCVFKFLDPSVKLDIESKVTKLYAAWEDYRGDTSIYDQENYASPGCVISETISWEQPIVVGP